MQPEDLARRDVSWDAATATLTVGGRTTTVTCDPGDNESLLRIYLELVAEQRDVTLDGGVALRRDDVIVLSELLDLDDADLEGRLRRLLHLSGREAAELHRRLRRQRLAGAAFSVGMLAVGMPIGAALSDAANHTTAIHEVDASSVSTPPAPGTPVTVTVTTPPTAPPPPVTAAVVAPIPDPVGDPIPDPVTPAAPMTAPAPEGTDIGYTVTYERDPDFVAPDGVDIGDSLVIERDAPPPTDAP